MNSPSARQAQLLVLAPLDAADFEDLLSSLRQKGISYEFSSQEPTPYAALEWLVPSAVVFALTHSYFDGFVKEIAKDHYQWFKTAVESLHRKLLGKAPEKHFAVVSSGKARKPSHFSGTLSFYFVSDHGYRVKLLFPLDITLEDYLRSCEEFVSLLSAHVAQEPDDSLGEEVVLQATTRAAGSSPEHGLQGLTVLIFWDRHTECFRAVDAIESAKTKTLVVRELGRA